MMLVVLFLVALLAFSLSSFVGGGASLVLIPLLSLMMPIAQVPGSLVIGTFTSSGTRALTLRDSIRWEMVMRFVPAALPSVALGAWLLRYIDPLLVTWISSLFLVSNLIFLFKKNDVSQTQSPSNWSIAGIGFLAGLLSGITGAVGLVFNGFYLRSGFSKQEIVATRAANEILLHLIKLVLYIHLGLFSFKAFEVGCIISLAAILSSIATRLILPYVSENSFRVVGYIAMTVSGISLLSQSTVEILRDRQPAVRLVRVHDGVEARVIWAKVRRTLEVEYSRDVSFERSIALEDVPQALRPDVRRMISGADHAVIEEVFGWGKHIYEVNVFRGVSERKYEVSLEMKRDWLKTQVA